MPLKYFTSPEIAPLQFLSCYLIYQKGIFLHTVQIQKKYILICGADKVLSSGIAHGKVKQIDEIKISQNLYMKNNQSR